ncbi:MAG: zf-TFIIB domain-containing protein [Actinomycetota bacterium]
MNCPECNVNLVMSERQGIEIDYCPNCRGVWLDRGELDKIIERSATISENTSSPKRKIHDDHDSRHHDYYRHRKKNWLGDLFD